MRTRAALLAFVVVSLAVTGGLTWSALQRPSVRAGQPKLRAVGPRLVSNQTAQSLTLYAEGLAPGVTLWLGAPFSRELPVEVLDDQHGFLRLPADLSLPKERDQAQVTLSLGGGDGEVALTLVNDAAFPELLGLAASSDGRWLFAPSVTEDVVYALDATSGAVQRLPVLDGPSAVGLWKDAQGVEWLVVAHRFSQAVLLMDVASPVERRRTLSAPSHVARLQVDAARKVAYLSEQVRDTVVALSLEDGTVRWRTPVAPNPGPLAVSPDAVWVGSQQAGVLEKLSAESGAVALQSAPRPGTPILGGGTRAHSAYVMGGKAPRDLALTQDHLLVSSIGPNIGPNPDRLEVSMNGGVGVVRATDGQWKHHLGFGAGVTQALAVDERAGLVYASDMALGQVRVLSLSALLGGAAERATVQTLAMPLPARFPTVRPPGDFDGGQTAGVEFHAGPQALALSADGSRLCVLNRFTGEVAVFDVSLARDGKARLFAQWPLTDTLAQRTRRLGQVLYFADVGRTAMSCDACHLEGHTEGVFFEKTHPMRIYRANTLRGIRETPPYFTPASTQSLAQTAQEVGGRNRYHHPDLTPFEVEALAAFSALISPLPNPYLEPSGALAERVTLSDGRSGNPRRGLAVFEQKAGCPECHPAPHFTTDQTPKTRGRYLEVGTPRVFPLRPELQDATFRGFAPPSLLGAWDVFPMFTTGTAGFGLHAEGDLYPSDRHPLEQAVLGHANGAALSATERADLLAYLLSL